MSNRIVVLSILALVIAGMSMASACASLQTPNNPNTQALGGIISVTGAVAPILATTAFIVISSAGPNLGGKVTQRR